MTLDALAVESYTQGRLNRDDAETARQLAAALAAARRYCGWHVTPVATNESITLDGPGGRTLMLPTLQLGTLTSISENGVSVNLADVQISSRGLVLKNDGTFWTDKLGGIVAVITHGYATAPDFEAVIHGSIDRGAFSTSKTAIAIGPFRYAEQSISSSSPFTDAERAVLDLSTLEKRP